MKKSAGIFALLFSALSLTAQVPETAMLKVFAAAHRSKPSENVLISPWGIQQCFGMLALSRGGKSSAELDKILNLNDQTAIELQKARVSLQASKKFNSFNGIFLNKKYTMEKSFIDRSSQLYGSKLYLADFTRQTECANLLNAIIKRESSNMFEKVFKPSDLAGDPAMILFNVLHFKDRWMDTFQEFMTRKERFTIPSDGFEKLSHIKVDMMNDSRYLPYYNDGKVHGVILDYAESRYKMLVLTTVNPRDKVDMAVKLLEKQGIKYIEKKSSSQNKTRIKLPKLDLSTETDLKELFGKLNITNLFHPQAGDLSNIAAKQPLYVDKATQLVKLKLDENGSEVAAVTYAMVEAAAAMPQKIKYNYFYADHPFVLVLFDSTTRAMILAGIVVKPR